MGDVLEVQIQKEKLQSTNLRFHVLFPSIIGKDRSIPTVLYMYSCTWLASIVMHIVPNFLKGESGRVGEVYA